MTRDEYVQAVEESADSYVRTIEAIICLQGALLHDREAGGYPEGVYYLPCRRMQAEDGTELTPDIVAEIPRDVGVVGDVKITASTAQDWEHAEQHLRRYDRPLSGWVRDRRDGPVDHDLCLVVPYMHKHGALAHFTAVDVAPRRLVLLAVTRDVQRQTWVQYEPVVGEFRAAMLRKKLTLGKPEAVNLEHFVGDTTSARFYDAQPPVEYVMVEVWKVANQVATESRETPSKKTREKQRLVAAEDLCRLFREAYSLPCYPREALTRQPTPPPANWVNDALETFVRIEWAEHGDAAGTYWLAEKRPRGNTLQVFSRHVYQKTKAQLKKGKELDQDLQLRLPGTE